MLLEELPINQIFGLMVIILVLIPELILVFYYAQTRIIEFLFFALFMLAGFISFIADIIATVGIAQVLMFQIHHLTIDLSTLFLLFHASYIVWTRPPKKILFLGSLSFLLLFFLILGWQEMHQTEFLRFIIWDLPHSFSLPFPDGAGIILIDKFLFYTSAFRYLGDVYRIIVVVFLISIYIFEKPSVSDKKLNRIRKIWILLWVLYLIHILDWYPFFAITDTPAIILVLASIIFLYITIFLPEGVLYSQAQLIRAKTVYKKVKEWDKFVSPQLEGFIGMKSFVEYIQQLPNDIYDELEMTRDG